MDRTSATAYLIEEYRELATDAKFTSQQTSDAYSTAIDMALRQLGVQEIDLATASVDQVNVIKYLALLEYYALSRFSKLLSIRFDVSLPGPVSAKRTQAFDQVTALMNRAEQYLAKLGLDIGGSTTGFQMGRMTLDLFEPSLGEF